MIKSINPLENKSDYNKLSILLNKCLNNSEAFKFLSTSLVPFDKDVVENIIKEQVENEVEFIVYEVDDSFSGVLSYNKSVWDGFELILLAVDNESQKKGIGQALTNECIKIALNNNFQAVDVLVYTDNKKMLSLLIKNDFRPINIQFNKRADGMDMLRLRKY